MGWLRPPANEFVLIRVLFTVVSRCRKTTFLILEICYTIRDYAHTNEHLNKLNFERGHFKIWQQLNLRIT